VFEPDSCLKPTCYAAAVKELTGTIPKVEYTILVKTKTPKVQRLSTIRNDDDRGRLGDLIQTVERAVDYDIFYPKRIACALFGVPRLQTTARRSTHDDDSRREVSD